MAKQTKVGYPYRGAKGYSYRGAKGFRIVPSHLEDSIFFES